jgi:Uma2 family endonuclease
VAGKSALAGVATKPYSFSMPPDALAKSPGGAERVFTREEYHAMGKAGILTERDRVELINGRIFAMMPIGPWHVGTVGRIQYALMKAYMDTAIVFAGVPVTLGLNSEPQPDVAVLHKRPDFYSERLPAASDVLLLIEVSDTSRAYDLGTKHDLYAKHGIAEFWVIDQQMACVHTFRQPKDGMFGETRIYRAGEVIPLPQCADAVIAVSEIGF